MAGQRERLADEFGAHGLAVALDQAAVGLVRKDRLRHAGDQQRVQQAGDQAQHEEQHDGWAQHRALVVGLSGGGLK